jgi:uncharacterized protein YpbB
MSIEAIAKERNLAISTIISHLELLAEQADLTASDISHIAESVPGWDELYAELSIVMKKEGVEKLKPLHEETQGKYEYLTIRLARLVYTLN